MFVFNPWLIAAGVFSLIGLLDVAKGVPEGKPGAAGKTGKAGKEGSSGKPGAEGKAGKQGKAGAPVVEEPGADG